MNTLTRWGIVPVLLVLFIGIGSALVTYNGGQVIIDQPVSDDVFVSGGTLDINAPVDSLTAVGGMININAPVTGDIIAAGGTINVNGNVGGKIVAAGGDIRINSRIGTNAVVIGGQVNIGKNAYIGRDALISGGQVMNSGVVAGNLTVRAQGFDNQGTAGNLDVQLTEAKNDLFSTIFAILSILFTIGMFILGLILLKVAPKCFLGVEEETRKSAIIKTIVGFFAIIISFIVLVLISITIVLLPLALPLWMAFFIALLFSTLFVSLAFGRVIAGYLKWQGKPWQMFVLGFILLHIIFRIPILGIIVLLISISLGFAAFFWTIHAHWPEIRGKISE